MRHSDSSAKELFENHSSLNVSHREVQSLQTLKHCESRPWVFAAEHRLESFCIDCGMFVVENHTNIRELQTFSTTRSYCRGFRFFDFDAQSANDWAAQWL